MQRKGRVRILSATTERIVGAIASFPRGTFSIRDVRAALPDMDRETVTAIICQKANQGWLERCGQGHYRIGGVRIKTTLPMGLVSEAVWAVLSTDNEQRPKRLSQITEEAESYVGRANVSLSKDISHILFLWNQNGHLERTGPKGEYAYLLKPHVTERPISN